MYLDTRSNVTVGVGQLLATVAAAQELPFVQRDTAEAATPQDIEADFNAVKEQPTGKFAQAYKSATKLDLPTNEIDALLQAGASTGSKRSYEDNSQSTIPIRKTLN